MTHLDRDLPGGGAPAALTLSPDILGQFMPLFLWLDKRGRIRAMGPTLTKILGTEAIGTAYARHFVLRRARGHAPEGDPIGKARRIAVNLLRHPGFNLRGTAIEIVTGGGGGEDGTDTLVNLSFGIHLSEAVRFFGLTETDFAASDLAIEFLFMSEAKAAVLNELQALTRRLEDARRAAQNEALSDALTGLANRRAFDAALDRALKVLGRGGRRFALLHLDLDFFKQVNDTLGHAAGDAVLVQAAKVLSDETRRGDLVARVGGDEFMMILRGPINAERVEGFAKRLISRLEEPILHESELCRVSASIGAVIVGEKAGHDAVGLLAAADAALYASKHAGRGRCTVSEA
ncbi:diguanylate cyclase (GGDEF)-like protein [Rhodobacter aestuarii]|uniref:Diguanylate cyclase (GGDEF) domain-containing protein n=1 Tax=Rhodobacter aestuarii TaxID=453582 RepID=A0A1N7MM93_9RHOB|nr:GGDEF domain-containing protein [Rhodobacter aestuarii]PTV96666.1 diguanylate cyclase (GGDEF)-like protein [Rhodobacter aestuarii]SIS87152.1 diguanylate cyclase (GGDEF) domain-containing protein [Rhodobacter aestuarii]